MKTLDTDTKKCNHYFVTIGDNYGEHEECVKCGGWRY